MSDVEGSSRRDDVLAVIQKHAHGAERPDPWLACEDLANAVEAALREREGAREWEARLRGDEAFIASSPSLPNAQRVDAAVTAFWSYMRGEDEHA